MMRAQEGVLRHWLAQHYWGGVGALASAGALLVMIGFWAIDKASEPKSAKDQYIAVILDQIESVSKNLGVTESVVRTLLQNVGEDPNVPPDQYGPVLAQLATHYKALVERLAELELKHPDLKPLLDKIRHKIDAGDYDGAERALDTAAAKSQSEIERVDALTTQARNAAAQARLAKALWLAEKAQVRRLRLDDRGAADLFAQARETLADAPNQPEVIARRNDYIIGQANALIAHSEHRGGTSLSQALTLINTAIDATDPTEHPATWARLQDRRGYALLRIGEQSGDSSKLEDAIAAFKKAETQWTRDRVPLDWAMLQNNLGLALHILGKRTDSNQKLRDSVQAFRRALSEQTRERDPLGWAATQNNLGNTLRILGERTNTVAVLKDAVEAHRMALSEQTRKRDPLGWAATQNNLGNALQSLGKRTGNVQWLEDAVEAYDLALKEWTQDRAPLHWAATQNNLGAAFQAMGKQNGSTAQLEKAIDVYKLSLEERTRERVPLDWAETQNNLGNALQILGKQTGEVARLKEAVASYRQALSEQTRTRDPLGWAATQTNLGDALQSLGKQTRSATLLEDAAAAYRLALEERTQTRDPLGFFTTQGKLATLSLYLAKLGNTRGLAMETTKPQ